MCNRARMDGDPETILTRFGEDWLSPKPMENRFNLIELYPKSRADLVREGCVRPTAPPALSDQMHRALGGGE